MVLCRSKLSAHDSSKSSFVRSLNPRSIVSSLNPTHYMSNNNRTILFDLQLLSYVRTPGLASQLGTFYKWSSHICVLLDNLSIYQVIHWLASIVHNTSDIFLETWHNTNIHHLNHNSSQVKALTFQMFSKAFECLMWFK